MQIVQKWMGGLDGFNPPITVRFYDQEFGDHPIISAVSLLMVMIAPSLI